MKYKVLLVDDHQLILRGLASIFSHDNEIEVVGSLRKAEDALKYLQNISVDLVLTGVFMPAMDGLEFTKAIKKNNIPVKVVVLTMDNEKASLLKVMKIGADGYLLKNTSLDEIRATVKMVLSGKKYFSSDVTMTLLSEGEKTDASDSDLSEREREILKLIAEGNSNKEIGDKLFISHRTLDTHRTNLMKKLSIKNIAGLVRFAIKNNIID